MKAFAAFVAAIIAAAVATAAFAAPSKPDPWSFSCNGGELTFNAIKTDSSTTTWHITSGPNAGSNFVAKTVTGPDGTSTVKGFDKNQNSGQQITCTTTSPVTTSHYTLVGVITPQSG